jgi:hypothetical protein
MSARSPRPLSALLYVRRNPRRVIPAVMVQALVTALVLTVVVALTGWDATAEAYLRPLRAYTGVLPLTKQSFDAELTGILDRNPALERHVSAKALWVDSPGIVGEISSAMVALDRTEVEDYLRRVDARLVEGRLPDAGADGVVVHADVARARGFRLGSRFGRSVDPDDSTPGSFTVVGILDGPGRVNVFDLGYASRPGTVLARTDPFAVVYAGPGRKAESDRYLAGATTSDGAKAFRVFDEAYFRRELDAERRNLRLIVDFVVGAVTVVVAAVTVLLHLIAFQARFDEFALLLAVGRTRGRLARKVAAETVLSSVVALATGLAIGYGCLALYQARVLEPRAILVDVFDAYGLTLACVLPAVSAAASAVALSVRLRGIDPIAVIQRRNA